MSLSYTKNGSTYVCYYYDSTGEINGSGLDVGKLKISVPGKGDKYIGLINKTSGAYAATTHPQESHLRITVNGTTYALAFRSKQITVNGAVTITSAMGLPVISYRGKGAGRTTGTAGAGGGGALAWTTWAFLQYTASISGGGAGGGQGDLSSPSLSGWSQRNAAAGEVYSYSASSSPAASAKTSATGGISAEGSAFNPTAVFNVTAGNGESGLASEAGGSSKVTLNGADLTVYSGSGALSQYRGSGLTAQYDSGCPRANSGTGGYGTSAPPAITSSDYVKNMRSNSLLLSVGGQPASNGGGSGGGAVARYKIGPEEAYSGTSLGALDSYAGSAGSIEMSTTYWAIGG